MFICECESARVCDLNVILWMFAAANGHSDSQIRVTSDVQVFAVREQPHCLTWMTSPVNEVYTCQTHMKKEGSQDCKLTD